MDRGTENTKVAALHYAFRENDNDEYAGTNSVRFGTSPANIVSALSCSIIISLYISPLGLLEN